MSQEQFEEVTLEEAFAEESEVTVDAELEAKIAAKAEAKAAKEAKKAEAKAAREAARAQVKAAKAEAKAAKVQARLDAKAAKAAAKVTNTMPEQNGVRHPKPDTICARIWEIATSISNQIEQAVSIKELMEAATAQGINENTIRTQYHRWRTFYNV